MTLSPDDLAAMARHHVAAGFSEADICNYCDADWSCDARRLLDEVEALRGALEHIAGQPTILIGNPYGSFVRDTLKQR